MNIIKFLFTNTILLAVILSVGAQEYSFEEGVPQEMSVSHGRLDTTSMHYKVGTKSLLWTTDALSTLEIAFAGPIQLQSSKAFYTQLYVPAITNDTLVMEWLYNGSVKRTAYLLCNYRGWREVQRSFGEFQNPQAVYVNALRMTLHPASDGTRYLCLDATNMLRESDNNYIPGIMWVLDYELFSNNAEPLSFYANRPDLPITTPTPDELADLETIRTKSKKNNEYNVAQALLAKNWVNNNISVKYNTDGTIVGTVIDNGAQALTYSALEQTLLRLRVLAAGKEQGIEDMALAFDNYMNLLLDQGLADGGNFIVASNSYTKPQKYMAALLPILPACSPQQRDELVKLCRWIIQYGCMYYSEDDWLYKNNSDIIYLFIDYYVTLAAWCANDAEAVRELRAVQRYMDRAMTYTPGGLNILKPDGTGFHHSMHYNNYMYAYQTFNTALCKLAHTTFEVTRGCYERFAKAVLAVYTMASPSNADTRYFSNTLCGRRPFEDGGIWVRFKKNEFINLINAGNAYPDMQQYLKGAYNYFMQSTLYDVPLVSYEGFHAFNWSPIGVHRHKNWVATMHAPTARCNGSEIYPSTNRFGRYQAHGVLDIMYQGPSAQINGYPNSSTGGGYDWNVIPGATTVHYKRWKEMMPMQNSSQYFNQLTQSSNFSGACPLGQYGVWASDFDQRDTYGGKSCFEATHLSFKKSVFVFDSVLVCLGSDINAYGNYPDERLTATNLYQQLIDDNVLTENPIVDGTQQNFETTQNLSGKTAHWIITPNHTGYFIPAGNDEVHVFYDNQTTPKQDGSDADAPTTTAKAAKAYINHGSKPAKARYEFVVVPNASTQQMNDIASQYNEQKAYKVLYQTDTCHAVKRDSVTGYTFFAPAYNLKDGIVMSTTHQHLLVDEKVSEHMHRLAICNPNLEPVSDARSVWTTTPSFTILTLRGTWVVETESDDITVISTLPDRTMIQVNFIEGNTVYCELWDEKTPIPTEVLAPTSNGVEKIIQDNQIVIYKNNHKYNILGVQMNL